MVRTDATMPYLSKAFQSNPHQKLFFHLKETKNYKKEKMKGGLSWMTIRNELARFLMGTIFPVLFHFMHDCQALVFNF